MKNWMTWTCVALALCFVVGMAYAQEGKREKGKMDGPRVMGKVKEVGDGKLVVTVKKEDAESDMTFVVNDDTKVFVGREEKKENKLDAVKAGANCMVGYKTDDAGVNTALVIRVMGERKEGERK